MPPAPTLRALRPEAIGLLDATSRRADEVVDPALLALARAHIDHLVADGPPPREPADAREAAVVAVIDQALVDISSLDDETVRAADAHFTAGALADLVMAAYAWEARTRLAVMSDRLLGGLG